MLQQQIIIENSQNVQIPVPVGIQISQNDPAVVEALLARVAALEGQLTNANKNVTTLTAQLATANTSLANANNNVTTLTAQLATAWTNAGHYRQTAAQLSTLALNEADRLHRIPKANNGTHVDCVIANRHHSGPALDHLNHIGNPDDVNIVRNVRALLVMA